MDELIDDIKMQLKDAENAHSYCAMNFSNRMEALRNWQDLLTPENVKQLVDLIDEQNKQIADLEEEVDELRETTE